MDAALRLGPPREQYRDAWRPYRDAALRLGDARESFRDVSRRLTGWASRHKQGCYGRLARPCLFGRGERVKSQGESGWKPPVNVRIER